LLPPLRYFGAPDEVDYSNTPWRGRQFDEQALTAAVAAQARNAFDRRLAGHAGARTLPSACRNACRLHEPLVQRRGPADGGGSFGHDLVAACLVARTAGGGRRASWTWFLPWTWSTRASMCRASTPSSSGSSSSAGGLRRAAGKNHLTVVDYIGNQRVF
jgi:hypothetical protein